MEIILSGVCKSTSDAPKFRIIVRKCTCYILSLGFAFDKSNRICDNLDIVSVRLEFAVTLRSSSDVFTPVGAFALSTPVI